MNGFIRRRLPVPGVLSVAKGGLGGATAIAVVAGLGQISGNPLLMAPFGATCVLLFSVPASPLSQPVNVVGGHLVSTLIGLAVLTLLPVTWWSMALGVGLAIAAMAALRITHPPAGADPLVVLAAAPGPGFVLFPTLAGSVLLVLVAALYHRIPPRTPYPLGD
ncbi:MAG: HPP family protein [Hyphomicrobiales bacterium]